MTAPILRGDCLAGLDFSTLTQNRSGMEREMLRVDADGRVSRSDHPAGAGHKLTHPRITVDFSEGLLELVTQPHVRRQAMLDEMQELQAFVARQLPAGEFVWAPSMPPTARSADVSIAEFGRSQSGRMKQVYRQGLASRYGKIMQIIAGIHYNFSFDLRFIEHMHQLMGSHLSALECRNRLYFRLIRGFDRHAWLLPYLFGASPVAARSSLAMPTSWLLDLDEEHVYGEFATSLRMSDIGYQSPAQADLYISHRSLQDYVRELVLATRTPWPAYEQLGLREGDNWTQLNANILQIENEYYSAIRPKQITRRGERPACALHERGVSYIEVRMMDIDPFEPLGMSRSTADFLEVFLLACLAHGQEGADFNQADRNNQKLAIRYGRRQSLKLMRGASSIRLRDWADEFLDECAQLAECLDKVHGGRAYADGVAAQRAKWAAPETLPSQRVLDAAAETGYAQWATEISRSHTRHFAQAPLDEAALARLQAEVAASFTANARLEQEQSGDLASYVAQYYQSLCGDSLAALL